ncbi:hypothetical protein STVA_25770 [Allostella vacuolata]|nr:hypothetical protein STVA_25770 [Stella vacuolata]
MTKRPYGPDTRVARLDDGERRLVAEMRAWIAGRQAAGTPPSDTAPGALDRLLRLLSATAARPIDMRIPASPTLGADEALLLHAVACAQHGHSGAPAGHGPIACVAREWLPAIARPLAERTIVELARALGAAGIRIPLRADAFSSTRTEYAGPPDPVPVRH